MTKITEEEGMCWFTVKEDELGKRKKPLEMKWQDRRKRGRWMNRQERKGKGLH